ncbi:hypothetical protein PTSG_08908 [Salpingoeca rosetta]|uniref:Uncharacterized protein n=1 Tax=Salpingoeca rosetta (strain ATCC 50818 / BSB-021) TaxID=946362 RepID=F2UL19_SALR5|nr:uncharacterized protein PTSG_08908 [Salpingoeca rosetta]EGD77818.1 hypothetical protein PTSG_08908 [Salpingoeca rosetta]|eukprot:XP_004990294.1 hypothetical protein PTSG_08908 [Salpingoeca rosetta]
MSAPVGSPNAVEGGQPPKQPPPQQQQPPMQQQQPPPQRAVPQPSPSPMAFFQDKALLRDGSPHPMTAFLDQVGRHDSAIVCTEMIARRDSALASRMSMNEKRKELKVVYDTLAKIVCDTNTLAVTYDTIVSAAARLKLKTDAAQMLQLLADRHVPILVATLGPALVLSAALRQCVEGSMNMDDHIFVMGQEFAQWEPDLVPRKHPQEQFAVEAVEA